MGYTFSLTVVTMKEMLFMSASLFDLGWSSLYTVLKYLIHKPYFLQKRVDNIQGGGDP